MPKKKIKPDKTKLDAEETVRDSKLQKALHLLIKPVSSEPKKRPKGKHES